MNNYIEEVALSGIEGQPLYLTPLLGLKLTKAYLLWLTKKTGKKPNELTISVGQDPRLSSRLLKISCFNALVPYGVECLDCDLTVTPAMEALVHGKFINPSSKISSDGAIMVTSSTGDPHMNGFKFFDRNGLLDAKDYIDIIEFSEVEDSFIDLGELTGKDNFRVQYGKRIYNTTEVNLNGLFSEYLCDKIRDAFNSNYNFEFPLTGKKILVDASNGAGGFITDKVFARLGATVSDSQFLVPDGNFFNHPPDPDNISAKHSVSMKVLSKGCDLGLLFNSDLSAFTAFDNLGFEIAILNPNIKIDEWLLLYLRSYFAD